MMVITIDTDFGPQSLKISADLEESINAAVTAQTAFPDAAALIFDNLQQNLFAAILASHPPATIVSAKSAVDTAQAALEVAKAAALSDAKADVAPMMPAEKTQ